MKEDHYESLLQIENSEKALFNADDVDEKGPATHETLKILIILKQEMLEREIESKEEDSAGQK